MPLLDNIGEYEAFARFEDFKDLYKDMLLASRKEPKDDLDRLRERKLSSKVDEAFSKYSKEDKLRAVQVLCQHDLVPKEWLELQAIVSGEIKTVTDTTGGNSFRTFRD